MFLFILSQVIFIKWITRGTIDRAAVRETQHGNHATQMCPLAHWATTYIQQTVNVTQRQLSSAVSSQRLGHSKCDAPSQLFTLDSQPRHGGRLAAILQAAQQLWRTVTANIFSLTHSQSWTTRIRDTLAASHLNPKAQGATCLAAETLSLSGCWSGSICDIAISLSLPGKRAFKNRKVWNGGGGRG